MPGKITLDISRKEVFLVALVACLLGVYIYYFTDWFRSKPIHIEHTIRPLVVPTNRLGNNPDAAPQPAYSITFALRHDYQLTSVEVFALKDWLADKKTPPLWHIVGNKHSQPTRGISYGYPLPDMHPYVRGSQPEPLRPGVTYRVIVEAGRDKGEHDFTIGAETSGNR